MWDPMDPSLFENILRYVQRKFNVLGLEELLFHPPKHSSKPFAAITFDDGYRDFLEYSIPLLQQYNMPAHIFVITDSIEKNLPAWTYVVDHHFEHTKKLSAAGLDLPELDKNFREIKWESNEERIRYGKKFKQYLKWIPAATRDAVIAALVAAFNDIPGAGGMMMSWKDVKEISASFGIGSHSVSHPTLATLEKDGDIIYELMHSKEEIKKNTGIDTGLFSYPCGSYDERVKRLTSKAGYSAGLAVDQRPYDRERSDLFAIPRIELYNESWLKSRARLNGTMSFVEKILGR